MSFKIYTGTVVYHKGNWVNEGNGRTVAIDEEHANSIFEYSFENISAKSVDQLFYILSKEIQESINSDYPIFIPMVNQNNIQLVGSYPSFSERFNNIGSQIGVS